MLYEIENHEDFNPDTALGMNHDEQTLTATDVEERMDAILRAWNWDEDTRDDALYGYDDDARFSWEHDTDTAFTLACNAPSGTPLAVFTAILEARGWPRDTHFQ